MPNNRQYIDNQKKEVKTQYIDLLMKNTKAELEQLYANNKKKIERVIVLSKDNDIKSIEFSIATVFKCDLKMKSDFSVDVDYSIQSANNSEVERMIITAQLDGTSGQGLNKDIVDYILNVGTIGTPEELEKLKKIKNFSTMFYFHPTSLGVFFRNRAEKIINKILKS